MVLRLMASIMVCRSGVEGEVLKSERVPGGGFEGGDGEEEGAGGLLGGLGV